MKKENRDIGDLTELSYDLRQGEKKKEYKKKRLTKKQSSLKYENVTITLSLSVLKR